MKTSKSPLFLILTLLTFASSGFAGENETITKTLQNYAKYANEQDVSGMKTVLHEDFRSIANQLFGSSSVGFTTRIEYLDLLAEKKIGGGDRSLTIISTKKEGKTAMAQLLLTGEELSFKLFVLLVQLPNGEWKIISDMPHIVS